MAEKPHWHYTNEKADEEARIGSSINPKIGPGPWEPVSKKFIYNIIKDHCLSCWKTEWTRNIACRQTKIFFPDINLKYSRIIMSFDRLTLGKCIRWITGHNFLRRHQHIIDPETFSSPTCRLCYREEETSSHLIISCQKLAFTRDYYFESNMSSLAQPFPWHPHPLAEFINHLADIMENSSLDSLQLSIHDENFKTFTVCLDPAPY